MLGMQQFSNNFGAAIKESIIDGLKQQKIIS